MSTVQVSRTTSTVEVSATRPRVEVGTPSVVAHNDLSGRDAADAHPIGAITGLLPLPTADGSRYVVSHPGGVNPPAWSSQAAWLDRANVFASGTVAIPEIALGGSTRGLFSPNANSVSISVGAAERMRITDASHAFGIARDLSTVTTLAPFSGLHYHGVDGNNVRHAIWCYKNGVGGATATLTIGVMQGTATTPAATAASDLVSVFMGGHDGSSYASAEAIRLQSPSAWTATNREFQVSLFTCANGSTGATERVRIASNGQAYFQNGSASAPGVSFFSSTGIGMYRAGADTLGIATAGVLALQIDASQNLSPKDGGNVILGATIGTKIGTATAQKLSFWNATPIIQPAAAGQAAPAAQGQAALTDSTGGTASTTLAAIAAGATYAQADLTAIKNALASLAARLAEVRTDVANIKTFQTAVRTALVNTGLIKGAA